MDAIFEFLFKYRALFFEQGEFTFGAPASTPALARSWLGVVAASAVATYTIARGRSVRGRPRHHGGPAGRAPGRCWSFASCSPRSVISSVVPQQNFVGVLIDDSQSDGARGRGRGEPRNGLRGGGLHAGRRASSSRAVSRSGSCSASSASPTSRRRFDDLERAHLVRRHAHQRRSPRSTPRARSCPVCRSPGSSSSLTARTTTIARSPESLVPLQASGDAGLHGRAWATSRSSRTSSWDGSSSRAHGPGGLDPHGRPGGDPERLRAAGACPSSSRTTRASSPRRPWSSARTGSPWSYASASSSSSNGPHRVRVPHPPAARRAGRAKQRPAHRLGRGPRETGRRSSTSRVSRASRGEVHAPRRRPDDENLQLVVLQRTAPEQVPTASPCPTAPSSSSASRPRGKSCTGTARSSSGASRRRSSPSISRT